MSSASEHKHLCCKALINKKKNKNKEVVSSYLKQELNAQRIGMVGTQEMAQQLGVHVSPFEVIPKKGRVYKWSLDLSSPADRSVNDGILKEDCSLQYASVSQVAAKIIELGKGTLLGKMDIQQVYRNIPVAGASLPRSGRVKCILTKCCLLA